MTAALYLASAAREYLAAAQAEIDEHVHSRYGICTGCGEPEPCLRRRAASAVFARYGCLPKRRPGMALRGGPS